MSFRFSRHRLVRRERILQRVLEMLPGATSWAVLLGMPLLAFWKPVVAAVLIIAFDLYWLLRLFYMTIFLVLSSMRLSAERSTDWMARVRGLDDLEAYRRHLALRRPRSLPDRFSAWIHRQELETLEASGVPPPASSSIVHVVIFTVAKERREILEPGLQGLLRQTFPSERILVVLAVEARASPEIQHGVLELQRHYRHHFLDLVVAVHPNQVSGEARVKGANATHAAKAAADVLTSHGIAFDPVVVSCFDADTVVSPHYMACLAYTFMACPQRIRASFQPIPVYHNNIWDVPGFARVLDIGSSFFQLIEVTNPDQLVTFSSHSMSFKALVEVGYWPVDMISDDSAIFWKALIHYNGDYRAVPMYITLSMDIAATGSWWTSIQQIYKQKRRWAWGVENFPLVIRGFLRKRTMPLSMKLRHGFKLFEINIAWSTWPFLLTIIGWLPALFAGREFSNSIIYYSAPRITATIFHLAALSLIITIVLSFSLLPRYRIRYHWLKRVIHTVEWCCVPAIAILFSGIPALDAQTRLMLGRYMEFWVTEKKRGMMSAR